MNTSLGKIARISFGYGGYQDAEFGVTTVLEGKGWGTIDFKGYWARNPDERCQWTERDQTNALITALWWVRSLLDAAKVQHLDQLKGKPIEVTFENGRLESWRILEEVL
jgi:hypothetical protein